MAGGPTPGNGPQGPPGSSGVPLPISGPPPHGGHPQGMPPMPPHHGMIPSQGGYSHAAPSPGGAPTPPAGQAPGAGPAQPPAAQTPPHGSAPPPSTSANGAPSSSPMQGSLSATGPDNLNALQRAIDSMEEKGLQDDPRYSQLVAIRARSNPQDPNKGLFSNTQLSQLK